MTEVWIIFDSPSLGRLELSVWTETKNFFYIRHTFFYTHITITSSSTRFRRERTTVSCSRKQIWPAQEMGVSEGWVRA